jgi:S-formylglutathione hydrolase
LEHAERLGIALVCPDTSPRGLNIPGEDDSWDFGTGAGFYIDAKDGLFSKYQMFSYVDTEIQSVMATLPVDVSRISIFGHSMVLYNLYRADMEH